MRFIIEQWKPDSFLIRVLRYSSVHCKGEEHNIYLVFITNSMTHLNVDLQLPLGTSSMKKKPEQTMTQLFHDMPT